jgi:tetratricopeptide (TPR) repeat protein
MKDLSHRLPWLRIGLLVAAGVGVVLALLLFVVRFGPHGSSGTEFARLMNVGKAQLEQGKPADAIASYRQALALDPVNPDVHLNLANAHFVAGQFAEAIARAREVLGLEPASAAARYVIGIAHLRQGQFEEAIKALQESQEIDRAVTALNFQLGLAYEGLRQPDDALREYQTVIDFEPEHPAAHYRLSQLYRRKGQIPEADQELAEHQKILAQRPNPPSDPAFYERCKHTVPRVPFRLEQPDPAGVKVVFRDVTALVLSNAAGYRGPLAATASRCWRAGKPCGCCAAPMASFARGVPRCRSRRVPPSGAASWGT